MLLTAGGGGLADFWRDVSYGNFDNRGTRIGGWYRMPQTTAQYSALGRWPKVDACLAAAQAPGPDALVVPSGAIRYVVTFPSVDMFGWAGGAFLPWDVDVGGIAHEGGHGIGLDHSFSNDPNYRNADWAQIGEYDDPWDAMSWANSFIASTPFGAAPSGLVAHHLDRMGWLPRSRIRVHGSDGAAETVYTLAPINQPGLPGALLVRIPYDPGDLFRYYTIELRTRTGWSAGIPGDAVLIHEVKRGMEGGSPAGPQIVWLQRDLSRADKAPTRELNANGVEISVLSVSSTQATVRVRSQIAQRCLQGFVWREARPEDHVCVTGAERSDTRTENQLGPSRRAGGGPFGPDTCLIGFVWREAYPGDHVCVPLPSRTRAAQSNSAAASRANPARMVFGPNTCRPGFVWREADDYDWICVPPATRTDTSNENSLAASRRQPGGGAFGPNTCRPGFVWREAYPGDVVCVPGPSRTRASADNATASSRLAID
ncbi:MAG TPA: hypothetical protein VF574_08000 [Allosphingosinicella sp.]|jgi:hypothetical protein